jgi:hypothetical protein
MAPGERRELRDPHVPLLVGRRVRQLADFALGAICEIVDLSLQRAFDLAEAAGATASR